MSTPLLDHLIRSAEAASGLSGRAEAVAVLSDMAGRIVDALRAGAKILVAGNGGSAADAQHLAAEFVSRMMFDRAPLAALALSESGSILTACGNDYGFDTVFARQVQALGRPGDVLLGLSTSGRSRNILAAMEAARAGGLVTLGFAGESKGGMAGMCDLVFAAPSAQAQIVQQLHMMAGHAILAEVEQALFRT